MTPALKPNKLEHSKIELSMDVTCTFRVSGWFRRDLENEYYQYGLNIKPIKLQFGEEAAPAPVKKAAPKKRKEPERDSSEEGVKENGIFY